MSYTYTDRKRAENAAKQQETSAEQPSLDALRSGRAQPTPEQMGRRVDLPGAMRSKMENAFGADLSAVKLYESQTVADAGAGAMTQGTNIAFAPGVLDFTSFSGQALLGHEISHVISQARGEVRGSGFLNDHALEARADREGAMAAAGQTVAPPTAALSPVSAAPAASPMQAGWKKPKPKPDTFHFASKPEEKHELPPNGVGFMLGMKNLDDPNRKDAFGNLLRNMSALSVVKGNRKHIGQVAYDAMTGNAYAGAVSSLEAYKKLLVDESIAEIASTDKARIDDRENQIDLLTQYITAAKNDRDKNESLRTTTLNPGELVAGGDNHGAINAVNKFTRSENGESANAFFKPSLPDAVRSEDALETERSVMNRVGIKYQDQNGRPIDPRLSNREIAYSRLSSLLGSSVGIGAKRATFSDGVNAPVNGVLMEEAEGSPWLSYNWKYYGPKGHAKQWDQDAAAHISGIDRSETWGDRLGGAKMVRKSTLDDENVSNMLDTVGFGMDEEIDAADPDFQRQMNEMFLLDTLATHSDRHLGNFHISKDHGKVSVHTFDNDLTFGTTGDKAEDQRIFGKRRLNFEHGGLPAHMQIDANMAEKIRGMKPEMLNQAFSDLLSQEEINSLWNRFEMMQQYVNDMERTDPTLIVKNWNEETAKRETSLAGGLLSHRFEKQLEAGGYAGNNYYQRQMLMLHAASAKDEKNRKTFIKLASGRYHF